VSATFPHAVKALADRFQKDPLTLEGTKPGDAHPDIQHIAYAIRRHETYAALVNVLLLAGDSRCLLFVNRRVDATELAEKLAADGFGAAPFSGELPQAQRTRTLAAFRSGLLPILVSTDVAARGIDVPDISTVIHVDPPRNSAAYVHRSGRTGRAGRNGRSIVLVLGAESKKIGRMLQAARIAVSWQPVPKPEQVEKALHKQARKILFERLAESTPTEAQQMAAKQLLEERDPIQVVAALLEMAKPKPPREPMDVVGLDPFSDERPGRRDRGGRDSRDTRGGYGGSASDEHPRRGDKFEKRTPGPRGERPAAGSFTTFEVSWGEASGASTPRLLSHVCRRGGLESNQVGAIRVFAETSTVEVGSDVADAFEARAARPDERDPGIAITRAGAGARAAAVLGDGARAGAGAPAGSDFKRPRPGPKRQPAGEGRPDFADRRGPRKPFKAGRPVRDERSSPRSAGPRSAGVPGSRAPHGPRGPREKGERPHADSAAGADRKPAPKHARKGGPKAPFAKSSKPFKPAIDGPPKARRKVGPGGPPKGPKR
jgi:ATP-dependent RNA helicase DeaD